MIPDSKYTAIWCLLIGIAGAVEAHMMPGTQAFQSLLSGRMIGAGAGYLCFGSKR